MTAVADAVAAALRDVGVGAVEAMASAVMSGGPRSSVLTASTLPGYAHGAMHVQQAQIADGIPEAELAAFLRGVAAGYRQREGALQVETVWTGPSHRVPVRATSQVLVDLVTEARSHLLLMTYSAGPHALVRAALLAAGERGVSIDIVLETLQGAGSSLNGAEPATAFAGLPGVRLWQWLLSHREVGAKMHAKVVVADRRALLVSSANLTVSGIDRNIEAGGLVGGGEAPERVVEHFTELAAAGALVRL